MIQEQKAVDAAEVRRITSLTESHFLDLKRFEITPAKLSQSISAFANTAGGELFVGIGEDGERRLWRGFNKIEDANGLFAVLNKMTALGNHYTGLFLSAPGYQGFVCHLIIPKTVDVVFATDGNAYVRRNAQNLRIVGEDAMARLRLDKGLVSFEDERVNVDPALITNSVITVQFMLDVVPTAEPDDWMHKQSMISEDKPIVGGVLLYADEPQATLPKRSAIKILRYQTREHEGARDQLMFDPITIEGSLYVQITEAVARTKQIIEGIKVMTETGLANVEYPHDTLHEILTNAVLHRDYSIAADIQIRIFENRIEIESPGRLPGHITIANVLHEQFARNPKIVRLINKFPNPPNKDVGEGLNTAFAAMKRLRLREPEIVENANSVVVHIRHTPLAQPQDAVMSYLADHNEITNRIGRELTGITSENVMKDVFKSLQRRYLLEPVPEKRGNASAWRKYTGPPREPPPLPRTGRLRANGK
jgi:ATP-dependent DNA helicase RecG